ncbi:hypothetical protein GCM10020256_70930 [Streptomyces thermocoprophilus]
MADELAEDAVPFRVVADAGDLLLGDADGVERRQPPAVGADHAERRVLGVHERRRRLHDAAQRLLEVQFAADRQHRLQQAVHPVAGAAGGVDPGLQLLQQLVQPQLGQPHPGASGSLGPPCPFGPCHPWSFRASPHDRPVRRP